MAKTTLDERFAAGDAAPDFTLETDRGEALTLSSLRGRKVILYFYPKDNTAGCTTEAQAFRDRYEAFRAKGFEILGVSRDSVKSHCGFRDRQGLNFPLLSDREETVCRLYGVMKEKMMYGKKCVGIERSTFVIDEEGNFTAVMRGVKAKTHVDDLAALYL